MDQLDRFNNERTGALSRELHTYIHENKLLQAKQALAKLSKEGRRRVVTLKLGLKAPLLFTAAQLGHVNFVDYLLDECDADIEQCGVYEVLSDKSQHVVTPLWCAAVANKLAVVKTLIQHGADVNAMSGSGSTPVRSSCFMTNIDVVKYLIECNADIHKPNQNGGTCLINSIQSVDLCVYLISKGASVNVQDSSGNLALHYAIREERIDTVKLLIRHGSNLHCKNMFSEDALRVACLKGQIEVYNILVRHIQPSLDEQAEALTLMAAQIADEQDNPSQAIFYWKKAAIMRTVAPKINTSPNSVYKNQIEAVSLEEISRLSMNDDAVFMQALVVRERIIGCNHKDTIFGLMYRGAVYADSHQFQRCVDLWKYAFQLRHEKSQQANNSVCLFTLQALCKLFLEINQEHLYGWTTENVQWKDISDVLRMTVKEVEDATQRGIASEDDDMLLMLLLHLLSLTVSLPSYSTTLSYQSYLIQLVHVIIHQVKPVTTCKKTLLFLSLSDISHVSGEFYSNFPNPKLVELLLDCGADPDEVDEDGNTLLHICADNFKGLSTRPVYDAIVNLLLDKYEAHPDISNKQGTIAVDLLSNYRTISLGKMLNLRCICARAIRRMNIPFQDHIPKSLISFVTKH